MKNLIKFAQNTSGRDFVVGDIHGCFDKLREALDAAAFNLATDRLFSVGDLVDRGPDSLAAMEWLDQPWFFAVRGNHEQMAINFANGHNHPFHYERNGGRWFIDLDPGMQQQIASRFSELPYAMEIETDAGKVGIVHAEVPRGKWSAWSICDKDDQEYALWARGKIECGDDSTIAGIDQVYVGHTPLRVPTTLGNVHYIDTGAVFGNPITVLCISGDHAARLAA